MSDYTETAEMFEARAKSARSLATRRRGTATTQAGLRSLRNLQKSAERLEAKAARCRQLAEEAEA